MILLAVVAVVTSFAAGSPAGGAWVGLALAFTAVGLRQAAVILSSRNGLRDLSNCTTVLRSRQVSQAAGRT
jgi:hypothetical protein